MTKREILQAHSKYWKWCKILQPLTTHLVLKWCHTFATCMPLFPRSYTRGISNSIFKLNFHFQIQLLFSNSNSFSNLNFISKFKFHFQIHFQIQISFPNSNFISKFKFHFQIQISFSNSEDTMGSHQT